MADLEAIAENLSELTVMEAAELKTMLEEEWGVEAASGGGMMMAMPALSSAPSSVVPDAVMISSPIFSPRAGNCSALKT